MTTRRAHGTGLPPTLRPATLTLTVPAMLALDALADALTTDHPMGGVSRETALVAALGVALDLVAAGTWGDHWPRRAGAQPPTAWGCLRGTPGPSCIHPGQPHRPLGSYHPAISLTAL